MTARAARKSLADVSLMDQINAAAADGFDTAGTVSADDLAADAAALAAATTATSIVQDVAAIIGEVEDNIPVPTGRAARQTKYNWDMNVGQSQFYAEVGTDQTKLVNRIQQACHQRNAKGDGRKFIVKKWTGPNGVLGARIWRTQ